MRAGAAWEHYLDASLVEARTLSGDTFSDDDLAKEFVDLEVALEDVPTAQPVAGAPMEHSAVAVAERIPLFTEYDRSTHLRFFRKLCLYFVCCPARSASSCVDACRRA